MAPRTAILVLLPTVLAACAGARETDLLDTTPPALAGETTETEGTTPLPPTPRPTPPPPASGSGAGSPPTPSATPPAPSSSSSSSSGAPSNSSSGSGSEPPQPWVSAGIACGAATCTVGSSFCCDRGGSASCATTGGLLACVGGTPVRCDDKTDCPTGQVCCASQDALGFATVQCQSQCKAPATRLCDPDAPSDECAAIGKTCSTSGSGYPSCS